MTNRTTLGVSALGACVLAVSAFSGAMANSPAPLREMLRSAARDVTFQGRVTVNNVLRVQKNASVYGHAYAHNGLQVWKGFLVHDGGIKTDSLDVSGPAQMQSATIAGVLQAGAISGTSLSVTGGATVGGTLNTTGKISGNGVDAGSGGLTTSGNVTAANISAGSISDSGALNAGTISSTGTVTAGSLTVTGNVNFSGATVSGLNLGNLGLTSAALQNLSVGTANVTSPPFSISENGHSVQLGVSSAGALTTGDLSASGTVSAATLQGAPSSGSSSPGALTLQGSALSLSGPVTLSNGSDLSFSSSGSAAGHLLSNGDRDVAGTVTIHVVQGQTPTTESQASVSFVKPFSGVPNVTVTPLSDPEPGASAAPKYWVTITEGSGNYVGFTLHYAPSATAGSAHDITFDYHVIG